MKKENKILIIDCGSQYTQLIARRVRELGVYSEILFWDSPAEKLEAANPSGIILLARRKARGGEPVRNNPIRRPAQRA